MAGALIQKKEAITNQELKTTFTLQQCIVGFLVLSGLLLSPHIGNFFRFEKEGVLLLQAFLVAFFLSSLKTIPSVILERKLDFGKLAIPQLIETFAFSITAIVLSLKGFGIMSFTYAVLLRGFLGVLAMYSISPWKIGFSFSKDAISHLLSLGIPLAKENLLFLLLGRLLPASEIGYIGFAQKWAFTPLRLLMDNIVKVTFATFSRLQHDKIALGKAFEKSLFANTFFLFPSLVGLILLSPYFIAHIPRYQKWEPALLSLAFFSMNALLAALLVPMTNLLNATGKIKISLYFMIGWTLFMWLTTPFAVMRFGFNAFAFLSILVNLSVIPIYLITRRYVPFHFLSAVKNPFIATILMGVFLYYVSPVIENLSTLLLVVVLGSIVYFLTIFAIGRSQLKEDLRFLKHALKT